LSRNRNLFGFFAFELKNIQKTIWTVGVFQPSLNQLPAPCFIFSIISGNRSVLSNKARPKCAYASRGEQEKIYTRLQEMFHSTFIEML
jgi:hypothetical protein